MKKLAMKDINLINSEFKRNNLSVIWNKLKIYKMTKVNSNLNAHNFENHFNSLMKDEIPLNPDQLKIKTEVQERSLLLSRKYHLPSKSTNHAESYTNRSNVAKEDVLNLLEN